MTAYQEYIGMKDYGYWTQFKYDYYQLLKMNPDNSVVDAWLKERLPKYLYITEGSKYYEYVNEHELDTNYDGLKKFVLGIPYNHPPMRYFESYVSIEENITIGSDGLYHKYWKINFDKD